MLRSRHRAALWVSTAGVVVLIAAGVIVTAGTAQAAVGCHVTYAVGAQWQGGFTANVNLTNPAAASSAVNGVTCTGGTASTTPPATTPPVTPPPTDSWPTPTGQVAVNGTIPVSGLHDGGMRRYCCIGDGSQEESQDPMFELADGATLQNVIIGAPAADGVHCAGSCTLRNVWWEDAGEEAATFRGTGSPTFLVDGGGARAAGDKVFQHNGAGTLTIQNFQATNFGTFYRSCANCFTQTRRNVVIRNVTLTRPGNTVAGINTNYGDTARFSGITIVNDANRAMDICRKYTGNNTGGAPTQVGTGADSTNCFFAASDLIYR